MIKFKSHLAHAAILVACGFLTTFLAPNRLFGQTNSMGGGHGLPEGNPITKLRGIIILPTYAQAASGAGVTGPGGVAERVQRKIQQITDPKITNAVGIVVVAPEFLSTSEFIRRLQPFLDKPLTDASLAAIQFRIRDYCKSHGHLIVDVITPEQDVVNQVIRIAVVEGELAHLKVTQLGKRWFADSILIKGADFKTNAPVLEGQLNSGLVWVNNNTYQSLGVDAFSGTFRDVSASFSRGEDIGHTDIDLRAQERFPLRVFAGYDDSGITAIGEDQFFGGLTWANAFGLDHRASYTYLTDANLNRLQQHSGSYAIPLPGHQLFTIYGAFANLNPDFSDIPEASNLRQKGQYYQLTARHLLALPSLGNYDHSLTFGFDYKNTDTPLLFTASTASTILQTNRVQVNQFSLEYAGRLKDHFGTTGFNLQGVYSPGGLTENDDTAEYDTFRRGTTAHYLYGRAVLQRETLLPLSLPGSMGSIEPRKFTWFFKASGQFTDNRLITTEQLGLGGFDTVRGYDERIVEGDFGYLINNELRAPRIKLGNLTRQANHQDWMQAVLFCDYGSAYNQRANSALLESYHQELTSLGVGLRYEVADNLRFRFDYGFQLSRSYATTAPDATSLGKQPSSRANFGVELSF